MTPSWVAALLDSSLFRFLARVVLVVTFAVPGVMQAMQFQGTLGDFAHFNVNPPTPFVILSIVTLLGGSAIVIRGGAWTWLGAGALGVYTGLTILIVHHFWTMQGSDGLSEMRTALEHISLIGGLMVVAVTERQRSKPPG